MADENTDSEFRAPPNVALTDGYIALGAAGIAGGVAPFLLRMGLSLSKGEAIPSGSVWMGIAIFGILGLGVACALADRTRRQYFFTAMAAPALITNATVGLNNAAQGAENKPAAQTSFVLVGSAFAQEGDTTQLAFPQGGVRPLQLNLDLRQLQGAGAGQLVVTVPNSDGQDWSQYCQIAQDTTCNVVVPADANEVHLSTDGVDKTVSLPPNTTALDVGLTGQPSVGQQLWYALGGSLRGQVTGIEAQALTAGQ
jgi:hypothetical protein